jgi:methylphosphotriester-DNA--protein-cysteine methyltransferase
MPPVSNFLAEGVWQCPDDTTGASFVGSDKSNKFHYLSCEWAKNIKDLNRICFASRDAALAYGYVPCGVCKP